MDAREESRPDGGGPQRVGQRTAARWRGARFCQRIVTLMFRAFVILGGAIDVLIALFLILVSGWIMDSWHDPNGAWVGVSVTSAWLFGFVASAGAPILGYVLSRRASTSGRIALAVWLPAILLIGICMIGLLLSPP